MVIVDSGSRHVIVRLMAHGVVGGLGCGMFLLALVAAFWMGAEGSTELAPITDRLTVAGLLLAVGLALILAAIGYGLRYVAWLEVCDDRLTILTLSLLGWRSIDVPASDFRLGVVYAPRARHQGRMTEAPWKTFTLNGFWFPFIIDLYSARIDYSALAQINLRTG